MSDEPKAEAARTTEPCPFYGMPCEFIPMAHASVALLGALEAGLAGIDRANAECPPTAMDKPCAKCGATRGQNCGPWVTAAAKLETAARTAIRQAKGEA